MSTAPPQSILHYPESDGKPMAETEIHLNQMMDLIFTLRQYFRDDPQTYVAGNMLMYYEENNTRASVAPDVFLVRGIPKKLRRIYKIWEEGKAPDLIIEVTSKSTRLEDAGEKKAVYAMMGVKEYFRFDPLDEYLTPPFQGHRLQDEDYVRMEPSRGRLRSDVTGLEFGVLDGQLRVFIAGETDPLPTAEEEARLRLQAELALSETKAAKEAEAEARKAAEEEIQRLRAEIEALKKQQP